MSRRVAFCLVENDNGEVLFVQRGYGSRKGKWSLPGGNADRGESRRHAAYRETKEETGIIVQITHLLFTGENLPIKVFVGKPVGGKLRFQRRECLDVRWRNPAEVKPEELAFGGDRKALQLWAEIKRGEAQPEETYTTGDIGDLAPKDPLTGFEQIGHSYSTYSDYALREQRRNQELYRNSPGIPIVRPDFEDEDMERVPDWVRSKNILIGGGDGLLFLKGKHFIYAVEKCGYEHQCHRHHNIIYYRRNRLTDDDSLPYERFNRHYKGEAATIDSHKINPRVLSTAVEAALLGLPPT